MDYQPIAGKEHINACKDALIKARRIVAEYVPPTPVGDDSSLDWLRKVAPEIVERSENQNAFVLHKQAADRAIVASENDVKIPLPNSLSNAVRDRNWQIQEAIEIAVLRYCDGPQTFNLGQINREFQDSSWLEIGRFEWHSVRLSGNAYRHLKAESSDSFRMYSIVRCSLRALLGI
ncbi:MAG: hypothetical protein HC860_18745 [Alkalinema sp. RU_4_3]|nr:hypothetical protein [Alkalinema sp. RU_4_3]